MGLSGIVASGCGDDDDTPGNTAGASGSSGSGGRGGSDAGAGKGGSAGKGGTGGGTMDAATDVSNAQCRAAVNSGVACTDACFCNTCPTQIYTCFTAPECAAVLTCIRRTGCPDPTACQAACLPEISAASAYLMLLTNTAFQG
ncbi:MAG TPA: hypothetical protein VK550_17570, partial [Polyangiaceae bacterium]|nr:hypothetical protein [Polyangiaceae bacterium]